MKAGRLIYLLAAGLGLTAEAANRSGYLPAIGPGPLRWHQPATAPATLPPLQAIIPVLASPPPQPAQAGAVNTNLPAPGMATVGPGAPAATNQATATNLVGTAASPASAKVPALLSLLPFFERTTTNGVTVAAPLFLPPQTPAPPPSSSSRYSTP